MELKFIETKKCPICGCDTVIRESVQPDVYCKGIRQHCNGGRWEERKFLCGMTITYEPIFFKEEQRGRCMNDPVLKEQMEKRKRAKKALIEFINGLDCADEDKKIFLHKLTD